MALRCGARWIPLHVRRGLVRSAKPSWSGGRLLLRIVSLLQSVSGGVERFKSGRRYCLSSTSFKSNSPVPGIVIVLFAVFFFVSSELVQFSLDWICIPYISRVLSIRSASPCHFAVPVESLPLILLTNRKSTRLTSSHAR